MDETLKQLRKLTDYILKPHPGNFTDLTEEAENMATLFDALDKQITVEHLLPEAWPPFKPLLEEAYSALEALQEHHDSTLSEMLAGDHGYVDDDHIEALESLLSRIQPEIMLRDDKGNRSIFDDVDK